MLLTPANGPRSLRGQGTVIARGTEEELKARSGGSSVTVTLSDPADLPRVRGLLADLVPAGAVESVDAVARTVSVPVTRTDHVVPTVVRALDAAGLDVLDVAAHEPTLDDVFLQLTGHTATTDDPGVDADSGPEPGRPATSADTPPTTAGAPR